MGLAFGLPEKHSPDLSMRDRCRWPAFVVLVLWTCAPVLGSAPKVVAEPTYKGHPLSYWVLVERRHYSVISSYRDWDLDAPAKAAVRKAGTNAIPYLLEWLSSENGVRASWAFRELGRAAEPAIPELARMAANLDYAISALGWIGPPAIPALSVLATNRTIQRTPVYRKLTFNGTNYSEPMGYPTPRCPAVCALADMGTNAMAAVPAFVECLRDEDAEVVFVALSALRRLHVCQHQVFAAEQRALSSTNPKLRRYAFIALDESNAVKPFGGKVLPEILLALQDQDLVVSGEALIMVIKSAPQALTNAEVVAGAAEGLRSPDRVRQLRAAQMLRAAGRWAQEGKVDMPSPMRSMDWDRVLAEGTNALRRLATELVKH
jgi:hypothetical protein